MYYVYIIQHNQDKDIYTGFTSDIHKRLSEHNTGTKYPKAYTNKGYGAWILVYYEAFASKRDAQERERKLKQRGYSKRHLKKRIKNSLL